RYKLITNVRSSLMAVNIHITIIELNALHTKRQNLFQELDAVIHLLMEAKHWGLRKSRNATRSEERFSRNAETDHVCRLLLEKKTSQCSDARRSLACAALRRPGSCGSYHCEPGSRLPPPRTSCGARLER